MNKINYIYLLFASKWENILSTKRHGFKNRKLWQRTFYDFECYGDKLLTWYDNGVSKNYK